MSRTLPDFDLLKETYLGKKFTADEVKKFVGGGLNSKDVTNTCIVRLSKPLNDAGELIPVWTLEFRTRQGKDKRWYGLRVKEFWSYMVKSYGKPTISAKSPLDKKAFRGIRGIIGFRVSREHFNDATGHFTLWDGFDLLHGGDEHDYWQIAYEAAIWEAGNIRTMTPDV